MSTLSDLKESIYSGEDPALICDLLILAAVEMGSSDVHIEPLESVVRVRYRVDGVLKEILEYQPFLHQQIVARYKILGHLKMDETRMPQDGRISRGIQEKELDLRLSTLPTVHGEKIVMRIVDKSTTIPPIDVLGIEGQNAKVLDWGINQPNGIILTSGPTGSGKSTTLYSLLIVLNKPKVNIMTIEDPVENVVDGLNQSQVFPTIGYTFANGLRTALRQDPDIIMVGEIRDKETIDIAIEASLTGHLVFSTIHTNSAAETLTRILNMGIQPFLLPAAINCIIAQRLIRRLCPDCKEKVPLSQMTPEIQKHIKDALSVTSKKEITSRLDEEAIKNPCVYKPGGCEKCMDEGYKGRLGIYEVMKITQPIKELILEDAPSLHINRKAVEDGMISLLQDGTIKVLQGLTSFEEMYRIVKET